MALLLTGAAVLSGSHAGPLHPDLRHMFGFAPQHLPAMHWHRLFTSVFLTSGGTTFYQTLAMLVGCVAWCEWLVGTRKTLLIFWGTHVATLAAIFSPMALTAASLGFAWAQLLVHAADVGPSAGYYACLGVAVSHLPATKRRALVTALLTILVVRLALSIMTTPDHGRQMAADLAHLIAFPMGTLLGPWMVRRPVARESLPQIRR